MNYIEKMIARYGNPIQDHITFEKNWMEMLTIPDDIAQAIPHLPHRLYVNKDMGTALIIVLRALIAAGVAKEIKSFDGSYNVRPQRNSNVPSTHCFSMSIDLNAHDNPFGHTKQEDITSGLTPFSDKFLQVWRDHGWVDGADFCAGRGDLMHFEYTKQFMS